jgi:phosphonate transport system ATP-binding protein
MRVFKGRVKPATGACRTAGGDPRAHSRSSRRRIQRRIAMIDQEFYLVPRMRVVENVLTGCLGRVGKLRSLLGFYPKDEWEKAEHILAEVGLNGLGNRRVETLSGGQRQRAAIARALMQDADVILADEPISNLDPELAEDALELLVECVERRQVTLVVSLHQPSLAKRFATRLIGLAAGEIIYDGPPEHLTDEAAHRVYRETLEDDTLRPRKSNDEHPPSTMAKPASPPNLRVLGS